MYDMKKQKNKNQKSGEGKHTILMRHVGFEPEFSGSKRWIWPTKLQIHMIFKA